MLNNKDSVTTDAEVIRLAPFMEQREWVFLRQIQVVVKMLLLDQFTSLR